MSWKRCLWNLTPFFGLSTSPFWKKSWKHRLARRLLSVAFIYTGVLAGLVLLEKRLLYHPTGEWDWNPPPSSLHVEDVELTSADGTRIHAWWCPPKEWDPSQGAILYSHGNAGNLSHRSQIVLDWQRTLGLAVLIFDYPGFGKSEGKPTEESCYAAADAAYNWLVGEKQVPAERLLLLGGSLGGGVMIDLASRRPHRALLVISTFTSIPDVAQRLFFWAPARYLVRSRFDNLTKIAQSTRPVFIAHATGDPLIPFSLSEQLYAAAHEPKQFFPFPRSYHDETPTPDCLQAARDFLQLQAPLK
jgi:fermentation-respiration switch protein FrsA (DUF1100 family)